MVNRILSILSWVGIALLLAAVAIRLGPGFGLGNVIKPGYDKYATWLFWAGVVLVVLYTLGQWREIATYFQRRNARYGAIAGLSVVIVLGILIAVNYLSTRQNKRWDLTANKQYSLSDQTVKLLKGLDAPVKFTVFDQETNFDRYRPRLTEYAYNSSKISVQYIDPEKDPAAAKQNGVTTLGTIVISYKGHTENVNGDAEQDLTNGLIKVLNPQQRKVYFLAGHGEKDPTSSDRTGYSSIADALKRDNYQFDKLILAQTNSIPDDANELIVAGPKTDLLDSEVTLIRDYLAKGGKLLVLLDPPDNLKSPAPMTNLTGLLKDWGINATNSVVVDVSGRTTVATVPVAGPPYPSHAITDRFDLITMYPLARAMTPITGNTSRAAQTFVQTAARSWAETNLGSLETPNALAPEPDKGDIAGPVSVAVAVSAPAEKAQADAKPAANTQNGDDAKKPETRVAAVGDSDFAANAYLGVEGNRDLFMNTINWLAQQENLIAIRPREASDRRLTITASQMTGIFWLSIVIIPAVVFGSGAYSWWRRR
jgi:ABC-type uncharacterized transport system involved in gliding motility auxiliary subunit